jgi:rRNA-processing protein FCF1
MASKSEVSHCSATRRVLLDSNALDPLLTQFGAYETLEQAVGSASLEILFTHITVDEIAATPDLDRRQWLLNLLVFLGKPIVTSGAVIDFSRANFCSVMPDNDGTFEPLRSGNVRHSRDALIAHTAMNEGCALITNERRLAARAREQGVEVLRTAELLAEFS